ncbi:hypothetical protein HDU87_006961 [Geranomyces variabilis]|uniref:Rab-GAP TBC domain-containing protein n=1 Tax=Geranomyces variabilis TaxID=109894 RepID=A0AAD5TET5_9FUNG|nr:hypothetical protein HDU87_006961 [Geranomyces variabilis]
MTVSPTAQRASRDSPTKLKIALPTPDTTPPRPRLCVSPSSSSSSSSFLSAGKSYDQYGFLRSLSHTPIAEQLLYDAVFRSSCDARAAKWQDYMAKSHHHRLPPRCEKTKRYVRKGIPHDLRKRAWFHYSGAEALCADEGVGLYALLCCREEQDVRAGYSKDECEVIAHIVSIDRDVYRTFPENIKFRPRQSSVPSTQFARPDSRASFSSSTKSSSVSEEASIHYEQNPYLLSLRRVLVAFAYYSTPSHPAAASRAPVRAPAYPVGYCQSLNFVAAFLLLVFADDDFDFECGDGPARLLVEERVFWMLVVVIENLLPREFFGSTLEGARTAQVVLWTHLIGQHGARFGLEPLQRWLARENAAAAAVSTPRSGGRKPPSASASSTTLGLVTTGWFLTLFTTVLPPHALLRLWDSFIYQGEKVIFRFTLTLLALNQRRIVDATLADLSAWRIVKAMPAACYDVTACIEMFRGKLALADHRAGGLSIPFGRRRFGGKKQQPADVAVVVVSSPVTPTDENSVISRWEGADLGAFRRGVGTVTKKLLDMLREAALQEIREADL